MDNQLPMKDVFREAAMLGDGQQLMEQLPALAEVGGGVDGVRKGYTQLKAFSPFSEMMFDDDFY